MAALGFSCGVRAKLLQLYLTLPDPMDCSLPGSSVHGILQAGILECQGIFPAQGLNSYLLRLLHWQGSLPPVPSGKMSVCVCVGGEGVCVCVCCVAAVKGRARLCVFQEEGARGWGGRWSHRCVYTLKYG